MLIIISPAKIQNFEPQQIETRYTQPLFLDKAEKLVDSMRKLSVIELSKRLQINSGLAHQNADRFFNWHTPFTSENAKQAVMAYYGPVFRSLDAASLSADDFEYMQSHLLIFSGLYGILRPLDLIQPYRLEISTKLKTEQGEDLYAYWSKPITQTLKNALTNTNTNILLNLTSHEYFKSIDKSKLKAQIIDFEFNQYKNEKLSSAVIYIKKARGLMARYVIENRIEDIEDLKGFNAEGYWFNPQASTHSKFVFTR